MPTRKSPRKGSLQFWPRKRARKFLPSINWDAIPDSNKILKGFIGYKAGMASGYVKDNTPDSMTKDKRIAIPLTIIECPEMKIFSIRFYKNKKVAKDILAENFEKELKRKIKLPKNPKKGQDEVIKLIESIKAEEYDDVKILVYSIVKKTNIKKTPDILEIGLSGSFEEKIKFIKENIKKEISVLDIFEKGQLVDTRGLTKGKGFSGPVKRFGITLKASKSEKGRRRPGSLGPWHPARVIFRVPQAGQLGMFTRAVYNNKIIDIGSVKDLEIKNIKNYGNIKTNYLLLRGSIQGPAKRQLVLTFPLRKSKKQLKKDFEFIELK